MAKSQQERSAAAAAKRQRVQEVELRHRVRPGTRAMLDNLMRWNGLSQQSETIQLLVLNAHALGEQASARLFAERIDANHPHDEDLRHRLRPGPQRKLAELMRWHDIEDMGEAIQLLIMHAHDLGPEGSAPLLAVPRHEIRISESVAQRLRSEGEAEAARLDRSEA